MHIAATFKFKKEGKRGYLMSKIHLLGFMYKNYLPLLVTY